MKKYLACALLLLSACDSQSGPGADGYTFGKRQYERQTVQVNVVTYKTLREFEAATKQRKLESTTAAFTILQPPFDTCTIHMVDPSIRYEPEFVGHEFLHCVYGQWHTNNSTKS